MTRLRVSFQGAPGAYGEVAALQLGGTPIPSRQFEDVITALRTGAVDRAVLPVENSTIGAIEPVRRLLASVVAGTDEDDLEVVGEVVVPVHHCLVRPPGAPESRLERVLSHPAALAQCTKFFARRPELQAVPEYDTAGALDEASGQAGVAVIASERAAGLRGALVLERNLEDAPGNATRFVVLARRQSPHGAR
ncbi:MAG: prephenate dehydratase domain-containing protein [Thermoanaerobaculia bacterium]|nr:prephenate dehydratase domain-containing protein [Thermoanaerobaculia bacterium]